MWSKRTPSGGFQSQMSQVWVAPALGFKSTEVTSQPISRKALPTLPVPENSSSKWGIFYGRDLDGGGRKDKGYHSPLDFKEL